MNISGIQPFSALDFPDHTAAVLFTQGCNFRCGYCHNPELLNFGKSTYSSEEIMTFLEKRKHLLQGVVITGGEPTLQPDLYEFLEDIKDMGYNIKLDTNGSNPQFIEKCLTSNIISYYAMDIKAPLSRYREISQFPGLIDNIETSRQIIMNSNAPYEFRTTIVKEQLSWQDLDTIGQEISGADMYALQQFRPEHVSDQTFVEKTPYSPIELYTLQEHMEQYVSKCIVRH